MDEQKTKKALDWAFDKIKNGDTGFLDDMAMAMIRDEMLQEDKNAEALGIERLSVFNSDESKLLFIKPSEMLPLLQVNMYSHGHLSFDTEEEDDQPEVDLTMIHSSEVYRVGIKSNRANWWSDLHSPEDLRLLSAFFDVPIKEIK